MFVFNDSCIWDVYIRIIYNGIALIVINRHYLMFKMKSSVLQMSQLIAKIFVYCTGIHDTPCNTVKKILCLKIITISPALNTAKKSVNEFVIAAIRNTLIRIVEIIVIISKTNWNTFQNGSGKL